MVVDVRNARHAQQLVPDVDGGEVAQVDVVVAAVGREEVDDHQDVGRPLADGDPLVLHLGRQLRHGQGHAVLHHDQGRVHVGADVESDRQRVGAVVARLRRHVQHALDAVDLLLDRRRHGVGHHLGAGAGIADGDRHARRRDARDTGRPADENSAMPPISVMTTDSTVAKIGRSMKKREIIWGVRGTWGVPRLSQPCCSAAGAARTAETAAARRKFLSR